MPSMYAFDSDAYTTPIRSIDIKDFRPSLNEKTNMDIFQDDLLKCLLLKDASQNLPSLQALINYVRKQTSSTEESKVVYVEISSERADSRPTLISMLGKMYKTFVVQQNQKWLLVVGDAKTIKSIRAEYGDQMKWLIPWPGDWHILLNYQKAVMKA